MSHYNVDESLEELRAYYETLIKVMDVVDQRINTENRELKEKIVSLNNIERENKHLHDAVSQLNTQVRGERNVIL